MNSDQTVQEIEELFEPRRSRIDELNEEAWQMRESDPAAAAERAELAGRLSREGDRYDRGHAWSLLTLAACARQRGDHQAARAALSEGLELMIRCGDRQGESSALNLMGSLQYALGEYHASAESHRRSLAIAEERGDGVAKASALNGIGNVHYMLGEHIEARRQYQASLELARARGDRRDEATALRSLGLVHYALGEYPQALELHRASLHIDRETGSRRGEGNDLTNIGNVHYVLGDYPQALESHHAGLEVARQIGNRHGEANSLNNIGTIHDALGEYAEALRYFQASLRICQEIGYRRGESGAFANIGDIHNALKEYPQALEPYRAALDIHRESGNRKGEAQALGNIGAVHYLLEEYPQALEHYRGALEIAGSIGDHLLEAFALVAIADVHRATGDFTSALAELAAVTGTDASIGLPAVQIQAFISLGRTHAAMGRHDAAIESLLTAIDRAAALGNRAGELEASELVAAEYESLDDTANAVRYLRRHLELQKEMFSEETRRVVGNLQTSWQIERARKEAEIERLRNVELRQALEDLKIAQTQLVQQEKMASLGQLTAGIAHEINNPINFVSAGVRPLRRDLLHLGEAIARYAGELPSERADELQQEYEIDETIEEMTGLIATIESGAARTAEIVAGLRSFSRLDEGALKSVDLHEGLDAAVTILSGGAGSGVAIEREYGELPAVECYPGEINQVFMNILTNALKATEGEGVVTIRTDSADGVVTVAIADTGVGMSPEVRSRIFEPFFTTRDVGEGRGLGLSIAWGIMEKHGGRIDVESAPGAGSRFVITLPVSARAGY